MSSQPANWYPDPSTRNELRYWDGSDWTDHVSNNGQAGVDPLGQLPPPSASGATPQPSDDRTRQRVVGQVRGEGRYRGAGINSGAVGGGSLFNEPVLVVNQKAKVIEVTNQYLVYDQNGNQIAAVNQVGQSTAKKLLRFVASVDQFMTHKLEITDNSGAVQLRLTRPRKFVKSSLIVSDAADNEIGRIVQANMVGKIRFDYEVGGERVGGIFGENWRAWNFRIEDAGGQEVARITKTWEGFAKTMFTTADNYVVQIHSRQPEPFNSLIIASALGVDTALKQDSRGLG